MLSANRRILDRLDGVRFVFIVQVTEKVKNKLQTIHYEIVLRGIQPSFLHGGGHGLF